MVSQHYLVEGAGITVEEDSPLDENHNIPVWPSITSSSILSQLTGFLSPSSLASFLPPSSPPPPLSDEQGSVHH